MKINIPESDLFLVSEGENIWLAMNPDEPFDPEFEQETYLVAGGSTEEQIADLRRLIDGCHAAIRELGGVA